MGEQGGVAGPPPPYAHCDGDAMQVLQPDALGQIAYKYQHQSSGARTVGISVTSAQNPSYSEQRVTIGDGSGLILQCGTGVRGSTFYSGGRWSLTSVQLTFAIEVEENNTWRSVACSAPVQANSIQRQSAATFTYVCTGLTVFVAEVDENPYEMPKVRPSASNSGVCAAHGGSIGHGFNYHCIVVVETCQTFEYCRDGSKPTMLGQYACGTRLGFDF